MRIIAGSLGGRQFDSPGSKQTHPMSDKIRGALFNILGDISGLSLFDPFAGSGAISLEAASRGVNRVVAIDRDKQAYLIINKNVETLGASGIIEVIHGNCLSWSNNHKEARFDLLVLDPPYDKVLYSTLIKLSIHVSPNGLLVMSLPGDEDNFVLPGFEVVNKKSYGDAKLAFYRRIS